MFKKENDFKFLEIISPHCQSHLMTNKNNVFETRPICGEFIDIKEVDRKLKQLQKNEHLFIKSGRTPYIVVWKERIEDFARNTIVIVDESQWSLLLNNGSLTKVLESGKYVFDKGTSFVGGQNEATIQNIYSPCVYCINKNAYADIKWCTDSKVRLFDPESRIHVELGACGTFAFKVMNPKVSLFKTIGTAVVDNRDAIIGEITARIKSLVMSLFKSSLAKVVRTEMISCLAI